MGVSPRRSGGARTTSSATVRRAVAYRDTIVRCGSAGSHRILFLPGFGDDRSLFSSLCGTDLADRHTLLSMDLPGFGEARRLRSTTSLSALGRVVARTMSEERALRSSSDTPSRRSSRRSPSEPRAMRSDSYLSRAT
jgi:pimeloyl-ACP methyl ester carboxylesterase